MKIFETMNITIPKGFSIVNNNNDIKAYFGSTPVDYAFLNRDEGEAAIAIIRTGTELADSMVESQLVAYQQHYSRMVPGFQMGEMRKNNKAGHNVALMTYKSNAPAKDLFNLLAITTLNEKEIVFLFSCDMCNAFDFMYKFLAVLDSIVID